jgi:hypothetical protein
MGVAPGLKLAILANGPSLNDHDLTKIALPVMGLNRSWKVYPSNPPGTGCAPPNYHVALDTDHYREAPAWYRAVSVWGALYVAGGAWKELTPAAHILPIRTDVQFSTDLAQGVVCSLNGVGSVFYAALQVAYSLGYREVFALGLDLQGGHFDGTPASPHVERQNELFRFIPEDMSVLTCGSPESRAIFEKVEFGAVCE